MYREDLDAVITLLTGREYRVSITDSEHEYANLDEATQQLGRRPHYLSIEGRESSGSYESVALLMSQDHLQVVHTGSDRAGSVSGDIIERARMLRSRWFTFLSPLPWAYVLMLTGTISGPLIAVRGPLQTTALVFTGLALCATLGAVSFRRRFTTARLMTRHADGFWKRNSDKLWLLLAGVLLSEVVRLVLGLAVRKK
jgi:hypothetical protein